MKKTVLFTIIVLLILSCGQLETPPSSEPDSTITLTDVETTPTTASVTDSVPVELGHYVGLEYPPFPNGLSERASVLTLQPGYVAQIVSDQQNTMLWLVQITSLDTSNQILRVIDVVDISAAVEVGENKDNILFVALMISCGRNKETDPSILGIGRIDYEALESHYITGEKRLWAWRINTDRDNLETISTKDIACDADRAIPMQ